MKSIWNTSLTLLLAGMMLTSFAGCEKNDDTSNASGTSAENSTEDSYTVTESSPEDMNYNLTYESEKIPDDMAKTIAMYFYAIDTQNYNLYLEQIDPLYQESMEAFLQEEYGYGMETGLEQYHQTLVSYAGTDDFTITDMEFAQADEVLAENFEEDTDFVAEYLNAYSQAFGEEFTTQLQKEAAAIYDIAVTMTGKDGDGNDITILSDLELLVVERDDGYRILG